VDLFPSHKALLFAREVKKVATDAIANVKIISRREFLIEKLSNDVFGSKRCIRENTLQNTEKV